MTDSLAKFQSEDQLIKALSDILCVYLFLAVCPQIKLPLSTRQFGGHASCVCNICLESWVTSPLFTTLVYKVGSSFRCLQHFFTKLDQASAVCNTCLQSWVMLPLQHLFTKLGHASSVCNTCLLLLTPSVHTVVLVCVLLVCQCLHCPTGV